MNELAGVSLGELNLRAMILEMAIRDCADDPRVGEPIRQLKIIRHEIKERLKMGDLSRKSNQELEARRDVLQVQLQELTAEFLEIGRILDVRYRTEEIQRKAVALQVKQDELAEELAALENATPAPQVVHMNPIIAKLFAKRG